MHFKIYYGDGSVFEGRPEDAPATGVQAIAWNDPTKGSLDLGRIVMQEWDIYIYSDHVGCVVDLNIFSIMEAWAY